MNGGRITRLHELERVHIVGSEHVKVAVQWSVDVDDMARAINRTAQHISLGGYLERSFFHWRITPEMARRIGYALLNAAKEVDGSDV